jgi:hypothetical protein
MHKLSIFRSIFITVLVLLWATGGVMAAPPAQEPSGEVSTQATVGTAFTYQGNLADGVTPANGSYDFGFTLYNALSGGSQVGSPVLRTIAVTDGLFSVELDFGNVFDGTALWLEISVQPAGILSPRQPLTATPYAIYAKTALNALNVPTHDHWGETWTGSGTGLTLSGGAIGLSGTGTTYGVHGTSSSTTGYGVQGNATSATGSTRGVSGQSASSSGIGVFGLATATGGSTYGVWGQNGSTTGRGVYGQAYATTGTTYGVYGDTPSTSGTGVYGSAYAATGTTYGVYGTNSSSTGRGVYGRATQTTGVNYGVFGRSDSSQGYGVYGDAPSGTGVSYGVYGRNSSSSGTGVIGFANAASGATTGVFGVSNSSTGTGVYGKNAFGGYAGQFEGPVKVTGYKNTPFNIGGILDRDGARDLTNTDTSAGLSIWAEYDVLARYFYANSDARIKNIQRHSDGAADLAILNQIEITDYTLKDVITSGSDPVKKVIGQQVETVYPQAVKRSTDVVPDIYQKAPIKDGWVELATDLQAGERVRLIGEETQGVYEVLEVTPDGFRTDFVADGAAVFVFGREVDDFRSVDYDAIAMLNVSATQELNHRVAQQAAEIEALTTRLTTLEQSGKAASNAPSPWWLLGGLGLVGLVFAQKRRVG